MTITVERAGLDEESFAAVYSLLLALHKEGGYAQLDNDKASADCYRVMAEKLTFIARTDEGEAVGVLGLVEAPFWYSQETHLDGRWLYVKPEHRNGPAFKALIRAVRDEADACEKIAFLFIDNPDRRPKRTASSIEAQTLGYVPIGYAKRISKRR